MPYITFNVEPRMRQLTFEDILNGCSEALLAPHKDTKDTKTVFVNRVGSRMTSRMDFEEMYRAISQFNHRYAHLINTTNKHSLYQTFLLPKRGKDSSSVCNGILRASKKSDNATSMYGEIYYEVEKRLSRLIRNHPCDKHDEIEKSVSYSVVRYLSEQGYACSKDIVSSVLYSEYRRIDAPQQEFMLALRELKDIIENKFFASYHTSAFAYVRGRSTIDCVKRHQENNSKWFLKLDFSKFFPSTTPEFLMTMLSETYPICEYIRYDFGYKDELEKALSLCFLNGGLPQGTPMSPLLTNMMMIPVDYTIAKMCREYSPHLRYTRYADDILISSQFNFNWQDVQKNIVSVLADFDAPFKLNEGKTRYGSANGRNWNLGVMLNKDNKITIGAERKKTFKASLFQFMHDYEDGNPWSIEDTQHLQGLISYYTMVEKDAIADIIKRYSQKFKKDVHIAIKEILCPV